MGALRGARSIPQPTDRRGPLPPASRLPARAGFVLAGGRSTRMGRDKALLPLGNTTLVEHVAAEIRRAAGSVTLIGPPERYAHLGLAVIGDLQPGLGPLGGIHTALIHSKADWNLVVACDLPSVSAEFLRRLFVVAEASGAACLVPCSSRGPEPLCAVYHRRCLPAVEAAIAANRLKMQKIVAELGAELWPVDKAGYFENVNTPREWSRHG